MKYMLDTNLCIDIMRERSPSALEKLQAVHPRDVCVSSVTLSELEYGACRSSNPAKNRLLIAEFMTPIDIAPYDDTCALYYGRVRSELESQGRRIGPLDTMIAAHALALDAILVTDNEREFRRVPGLNIENWRKSARC